jgi:hypothetical protein
MSLLKHLSSILIVTLGLGIFHKACADVLIQENAAGFCSIEGTVDNVHAGYTGTGYANTDDGYWKSIHYRVRSELGGQHLFEFRYAHNTWARSDMIEVNSYWMGTVLFENTGSLDNWGLAQRWIHLFPGENDIFFRTYVNDAFYGWMPNID